MTAQPLTKFKEDRPYADPETAARMLVEIAKSIEPVQDGILYTEKINARFLFELRASPAEYRAGIEFAVARGWLWKHESGAHFKLTGTGSALLKE